jgi:hypothetical protein
MDELTLDNQLERLHKKFPFLWKEYGFNVTYLTSSYDMYYHGFILGLENDLCRLIFEKDPDPREHLIRDYMGKKSSSFTPANQTYYAEDGWYPVSGLVFWLTGIQYKGHKDVDLDTTSQYMKLHMDSLLDLYKPPDSFEEKIEYYQHLHRGSKIKVERIKEERARLKGLGQDWTLEAALASLRGGGK